jgi:hypothetical protein
MKVRLFPSSSHTDRQTEVDVVVRAHASKKVPSIPDYSTTINIRVNQLDIKINEHVGGNEIVIAPDNTGIKIANRGEWIRHKWNVRRDYLKIHVELILEREKNTVSMEVTSE